MLTLFQDPLARDLMFPWRTNGRSQEVQRLDDDTILITLEVPGYRPENISVSVQNQRLYVRATKDTFVLERVYALTDQIDTEAIEAKTEFGVLTVTLPMRPEAKPRQIPVLGSAN